LAECRCHSVMPSFDRARLHAAGKVASPQRTHPGQNQRHLLDVPSRPASARAQPRAGWPSPPLRTHHRPGELPMTAPGTTNGSGQGRRERFAQGNPCRPPRHRNGSPLPKGDNGRRTVAVIVPGTTSEPNRIVRGRVTWSWEMPPGCHATVTGSVTQRANRCHPRTFCRPRKIVPPALHAPLLRILEDRRRRQPAEDRAGLHHHRDRIR
jgi:hypothetical protein